MRDSHVRWMGGQLPLMLFPGEYSTFRCMRCNDRMSVTMPIDVSVIVAVGSAFAERHGDCKMTLLGARFELIQALYARKWKLEYP